MPGEELTILVTDATYMSPGRTCIAGWHVGGGRMLRPMLPGARWSSAEAKRLGIEPGVRLHCVAHARQVQGPRPHALEDFAINERFRVGTHMYLAPMVRALENSRSGAYNTSVEDLFDGHLVQRKYVPEGAPCRSLGGTAAEAGSVSFVTRPDFDGDPQLRCHFRCLGDPDLYDLPVTAMALRDVWTRAGQDAAACNALRGGSRYAHIRIGLARGKHRFNVGRVCYAMVNGVFFV